MTRSLMLRKCIIVFALLTIVCSTVFATSNALVGLKLRPLPDDRVRIDFQFEKEINVLPASFLTQKPPRLILDFLGSTNELDSALNSKTIELGSLISYNIVSVHNRVRIMLDLKASIAYSGYVSGRVYSLTLSGKSLQIFKPRQELFITNQRVNARYDITNIDFRGTGKESGRVIIDVSNPSIPIEVTQQGKEVIAVFNSTRLPSRLMKRFDVADFQSPAQGLTAQQEGKNTRLTILNKGDYGYFAYQVNKQFIIDIFPLTSEEVKQAKLKKKVYTGKLISLNFQNIQVRAVLQLLAEFTGINMVISDKITSSITLRLNNTPWDQALDIILATNALDKRTTGNVMWIAPASDLVAREKADLKAKQEVTNLAPVRSELLQLNYAKAADIAILLKDKNTSLLSKRGSVSVDARTNTLWIQDGGAQIDEIRELVKRLDIPVRQVLIEARIVDVTREGIQDLGIRFGVSKPKYLSGTLEGASQMAQGIAPAAVTPLAERLNVDLLAAVANPASIGVAVAHLGNGILLDLELSALESVNKAEIIASPRLMTINQQPAIIESGQEIPYQESTSSGATAVSFKKAVLSLKVTPQITPDNKILLDLQINQDAPSGVLINGVPAINTKQIQTKVLVENGQTVVLGGIYQQNKNNTVTRVPLLGELPVIGILFRSKHVDIKNEELLIFITPRIISNSLSVTTIEGQNKAVVNGVELDKFGKPVCKRC